MKRSALSLLAAIACTGGFASLGSASEVRVNASFQAGADVYKSIGDRVTNIAGGPGALSSSFGTVVGFNTGTGFGDFPVRFQLGASYGLYDFKGRLAIVPDNEKVERQTFLTAGFYMKGSYPISGGLVYDLFQARRWGINANKIGLGQVRGTAGYALNERTELGLWGTIDAGDDEAAVTIAGAPGTVRTVRAMTQANLYAQQSFASGGMLTGYAGVLSKKDIGKWQFGMRGQVPLSTSWSVYANFNYVVPSSSKGAGGSGEEQFSASFGVTFALGGKTPTPAGLPLLSVASNGSFLVTD